MKLWLQCFLGLFGWPSVSYDWSMVFEATTNQLVIRKTCPLKQSQKSLRRKLVLIHPLVVSGEVGEGNSFGATQQAKEKIKTGNKSTKNVNF